MNTTPFTDQEASDFWHEAQLEIYGEGDERSPDMQHAASAEQFVRWMLWQQALEACNKQWIPMGEFGLYDAYSLLESWLMQPSFEDALKGFLRPTQAVPA